VFENYINNQDYNYVPKAHPPKGKDWNDKRTFDDVLEADKYGDIGDLIRELKAHSAHTLGERLTPQTVDRLILLKNHRRQYSYFMASSITAVLKVIPYRSWPGNFLRTPDHSRLAHWLYCDGDCGVGATT
jgi:hypothetical protein